MRTLWAVLALLALGLTLGACGDSKDERGTPASRAGDARPFAMGLSSLPSEQTDESYEEAFERSASAGEVILIRRAPPWQELLEGGDFPSDKTSATARQEKDLAAKHGLDIFFAIDATSTSPETGQLAGLPPDQPGVGFDDPEVRTALSQYAQYVLVNYQPAYLALGVDVNQYWLRDPAGFQQFVTLYKEIYRQIKASSPSTLVFPTFQLEDLQGLLPLDNPHPPQWELLEEFTGSSDLLAVSTYPRVVFSTAADIPLDYYSALEEHADTPVAISETGFASEPGTSEAEAAQSTFLRRVLRDADRMEMALVVWFTGQDPVFSGQPPTDLVRHSGLIRQDGSPKPAWRVWIEAAERPAPRHG